MPPNVFLAISHDLYYIVYIEKIVENMYASVCATVKNDSKDSQWEGIDE